MCMYMYVNVSVCIYVLWLSALQELLAGRGGARAEANRLRKTKRQASGPETSNTDASTTAPSAGSLLGGILGDLHYTGTVRNGTM